MACREKLGHAQTNFLLLSSVIPTCCCIQGSAIWSCQKLMFSSVRTLFRRSRSAPRVGVQHGLHDVDNQICNIFFSSSSRRCETREARVLLWSLRWPPVQELQHHQMFSDSHPNWSALQILPDGAGIWSQPFLVVVHFTVKPDNSWGWQPLSLVSNECCPKMRRLSHT